MIELKSTNQLHNEAIDAIERLHERVGEDFNEYIQMARMAVHACAPEPITDWLVELDYAVSRNMRKMDKNV